MVEVQVEERRIEAMGWDISSLWHLLLFLCRFALEVLEDLLLSNGLTSALLNSKCALRERYYDGISFRIPGILILFLLFLYTYTYSLSQVFLLFDGINCIGRL